MRALLVILAASCGRQVQPLPAQEPAPLVTSPAVAPSTAGSAKSLTGVVHVVGATDIEIELDGQVMGTLPQTLEVAPGAHTVRFESRHDAIPRYASRDLPVSVEAGQRVELTAPVLQVMKGKVTFTLATEGATVSLVKGNDRRTIPQFPMSVDFDTSKGAWIVEATKPGFRDFRQAIAFDDGVAEKTIAIKLEKK